MTVVINNLSQCPNYVFNKIIINNKGNYGWWTYGERQSIYYFIKNNKRN